MFLAGHRVTRHHAESLTHTRTSASSSVMHSLLVVITLTLCRRGPLPSTSSHRLSVQAAPHHSKPADGGWAPSSVRTAAQAPRLPTGLQLHAAIARARAFVELPTVLDKYGGTMGTTTSAPIPRRPSE
jgi:hypothetical protein